ncbi:MAG: glutathione S-transferase [Pseudomonadota bacterium]
MSQKIRLHGFKKSGHSHRVELFLNLAKIDYEFVAVDLGSGEHKREPFLSLNPFGQVPVIEDGDLAVSDSNAILVYLAKAYASAFLPDDPKSAAEVQKFLTLAAGEIAFGPAAARLITVFGAPLDPARTQQVADKVFAKLEAHLEGRGFLVGDAPTIADVAIYSYTAHAPEGNVSLEPYPNIRALLKRIEALDGFVPMPETKAGLVA